MNFNWKVAIGVSVLVIGLILSGKTIQKMEKLSSHSIQQNVDHPTKNEKSTAKPIASSRTPQNSDDSERNDQVNSSASDKSISELLDCYKSETCPFPNRDPREYKLSVGQAIKKKLKSAYGRLIKNEEQQTQYWLQMALKSLSVDDGHVKEAALEVISTQEPNNEAFDKILNDIINYHDPLLIAQAMAELQKYQGQSYQTKVYQSLSQAMQTGSLMVKKEIVQNLVPFMNPQSLPFFQSALDKMNPKSNVHTALYKLIKDFKAQQTGA